MHWFLLFHIVYVSVFHPVRHSRTWPDGALVAEIRLPIFQLTQGRSYCDSGTDALANGSALIVDESLPELFNR